MSAGIWFWIIYVIVGLLGGVFGWRADPGQRYFFGGGLILYILIGLLGWGIFGAPLK